MRSVPVTALLSLATCLLLASCGAEGEPGPSVEGPSVEGPSVEGTSGPPAWRRAEAPAGSSAIQFHSPSGCFIRFRVEGASDTPHT